MPEITESKMPKTVNEALKILAYNEFFWDNRKCRKGTFNQRIIPFQKTEVYHYIELHCKFPTWKDFIETLAHEMVHLYQMSVMKDPYSNHNENFYAFREKFSKVGLRLYR